MSDKPRLVGRSLDRERKDGTKRVGGLWLYRGDSGVILLRVLFDERPYDITGCSLVFNASSASPAASLTGSTAGGQVSIKDGPKGLAIFPIMPAMTSSFPNLNFTMTFQWVLTDLTETVTTLEENTFAIRRNV
jgi:hypothetical protein